MSKYCVGNIGWLALIARPARKVVLAALDRIIAIDDCLTAREGPGIVDVTLTDGPPGPLLLNSWCKTMFVGDNATFDFSIGGSADPAAAVAQALTLLRSRYGLHTPVRIDRPDGQTEVWADGADVAGADRQRLGTLLTARRTSATGPATVTAAFAGPRFYEPSALTFALTPEGHDWRVALADNSAAAEVSPAPTTILRQLQALLDAACQTPDACFGDIDWLEPYVGAVPRRSLPGPPDYVAGDMTLHGLFAAQAKRAPSAIALTNGVDLMSYADLDAASNRVARMVREHISAAGEIVALRSARSIPTLVVQLGILKAGAAFLYLDPGLPHERARQLCSIARPTVTIESDLLRERVFPASFSSLETLLSAEVSDEPLEDIATPDSCAFVLFTSGSTGEPKGVIRSHRMQATRVELEQRMYRLTGRDRYLMKAVPFYREFFIPLATGGTLVVVRPNGERDDRYLCKLIRDQRITVCSFVPSMVRVLMANPLFASGGSPLRHLFTAGETFDPELERRVRALGIEVHITYTMCEAEYVTHRKDSVGLDEVTPAVGWPLDMDVYLCDPQGRLVPPGVVGEIYTGGPGLADGYLHRPELTAERFIPNPFDPRAAPVLFRTGDLARQRPDGQLEFVGRADDQVKVRGERVETEEVRRVLNTAPSVAQAAVITLPDDDEGCLLAAYVVPSDGGARSADLRRFLAATLPAHMVPSYIAVVPVLPLLPSGKLDRQSISAVLTSRPPELGPPQPPVTPMEVMVAQLWAKVLGISAVGIHDNFRDLGGDSLRAMLLRSALEAELHRPVGLEVVVECASVSELAARLAT